MPNSSNTSEPKRPDRKVKIAGNSKAISAALRKGVQRAIKVRAARRELSEGK